MSTQFTKKQERRENANTDSPAQKLGITEKVLKFSDVFNQKDLKKSLSELNKDWQYFWNAQVPEKYLRNLKYTAESQFL